ncbi:hypothetical protein [Sutcliffiella halmapala]|uniref:hypothetical protein n=1 Tax=Sutcliffiella halmapala TaxID=79882 RepID=UPI000994D0A9|nr:hypothetical protein [Sutcliffiella halmapala]
MQTRDIFIEFNKRDRDEIKSRWKNARMACDKWLTTTINENVKSNERALIIGAGGCLDFSLGDFVDKFQSVTLVDLDKKSMKEAVEELTEEQRGKILIVEDDITGIVETKINELRNVFVEMGVEKLCKEVEKFRDGIPTKFKNSKSLQVPKDSKYDFVFVNSITTQLFMPVFMIGVFSTDEIKDEYINKINHIGKTTNQRLLISLFRTIHSALNKGGVVAISSDTFEFNQNNSEYFLKNYGSLEIISIAYMKNEKLIKDLQKIQIIGGLPFVRDAINKANGFKLIEYIATWFWAFNEKQKYTVVGFSYKKN